jgi:CRISPR-associated protein Cas2
VQWIVVYDITNDVLRGKVSERLKDYGLERIQFSAFIGALQRHALASLHADLRKLLNDGEETDSVLVFPVCSSCFGNRIEIGAPKEMERSGPGVSVF